MADAIIPLSLKYRPKKLMDVVGQDVAVQILTNAFKSKRLHNAYIMAGRMGTGKTSIARILAAMENCSEGPTLEPCGKCKNCTEIFSGKSLDIKETDAASQRGKEDVENLKKDLYYSPMSCRNIYVIMDEVHNLTNAAIESLLKIIEEPPPNVRFLLCTTEAHLIKDTIQSRCIMLNFHRIGWMEIFEHIKRVAHLEGYAVDDSALKFIARRSKGSVRNSLQNLQAAVDYAGNKEVAIEIAEKVFGAVDDTIYFDFIDHLVSRKAESCMLDINKMVVQGRNAEDVLQDLEQHLRNLNVINICKESAQQLGFTEDEIRKLSEQGKIAKPILVSKMLDMLVGVKKAVNLNLDIQTHLENLVIKSIIEIVRLEKKAT